MTAKAIVSAKINSHPFEDRVLLLDVPAKIGRSHKEDQVRLSRRSLTVLFVVLSVRAGERLRMIHSSG